MAGTGDNILEKFLHRRVMRRWARAARHAKGATISAVRSQRQQARQLRSQLDRLIHIADDRLALPMTGSNAFSVPHDADWAWRPELWRGQLANPGMSSVQTKATLGNEVKLFHDCKHSELSLRQLRNQREADLAPYGLRMDVFRFDGSFLSLAIDLPDGAAKGLKRTQLLRIDTIIEMEKPLEIFFRLNIKQGPNLEQLLRALPQNEENQMVEFDLAYSKLNEKRVENAWIDLIFEGPEMNQVVIRDLTFSRRPRAPL